MKLELPLIAATLLVTSCDRIPDNGGGSGSNDSSTCNMEDFAACGGDLSGSWSITAGCAAGEQAIDGCQGGTFKTQTVNVHGTYTFGEVVEEDVSGTLTYEAYYPETCLGVSSCDDVATTLETELASSKGSAECKSDNGCRCSISIESSTETSESYSTAGNVLTIGTATLEYCVDDDRLMIKGAGSDGEVVFVLKREG